MTLSQRRNYLRVGLESEVRRVLESFGGIWVANSWAGTVWLLRAVATLDLGSLGRLSSGRSGCSSSVGVVGEVSLSSHADWRSSDGRSRCSVDGSNVNLLSSDEAGKGRDESECGLHDESGLRVFLADVREGGAVLILGLVDGQAMSLYIFIPHAKEAKSAYCC